MHLADCLSYFTGETVFEIYCLPFPAPSLFWKVVSDSTRKTLPMGATPFLEEYTHFQKWTKTILAELPSLPYPPRKYISSPLCCTMPTYHFQYKFLGLGRNANKLPSTNAFNLVCSSFAWRLTSVSSPFIVPISSFTRVEISLNSSIISSLECSILTNFSSTFSSKSYLEHLGSLCVLQIAAATRITKRLYKILFAILSLPP